MPKVWLVLVVIAVALTIFTLIDVTLTERSRIRGVPKPVWIFLAIIPILGAVLWFSIGRGPASSAPVVFGAPDDDVAFLRDLSAREDQDERIRRLEQELARLDDDPPPSTSSSPDDTK